MTTFLFISGFIINNTGNCGIKKDYCINYEEGNLNLNRPTTTTTAAPETPEEPETADNFQNTKNSTVLFNCSDKLNQNSVNIGFLVLSIFIFIINIFFIVKGFIPTPTYIFGIMIFFGLFILICFISADCVPERDCEDCMPKEPSKKELHNIVLSSMLLLFLYVIISTLFYDGGYGSNSNINYFN